eukprot:tig00000430_g619.t1
MWLYEESPLCARSGAPSSAGSAVGNVRRTRHGRSGAAARRMAAGAALLSAAQAVLPVDLVKTVLLDEATVPQQELPSDRPYAPANFGPNSANYPYPTQGANKAQVFTISQGYGYFVDRGAAYNQRLLRRFKMPTAREASALVEAAYGYDLLAGATPDEAVQFIETVPASCGSFGNFIVVGYYDTNTGANGGLRVFPNVPNIAPVPITLGGRSTVAFGEADKSQAQTGFPSAGNLQPGSPSYYFNHPDGSCKAIVTTRNARIFGAGGGTSPAGSTSATTVDAVVEIDLATLSITKIAHPWDVYLSVIPANVLTQAEFDAYLTANFMQMPSRTLSPVAARSEDGATLYMATQVIAAGAFTSATYSIQRPNPSGGNSLFSVNNAAAPATSFLLKFDVATFSFALMAKISTTDAAAPFASNTVPYIAEAANIYIASTGSSVYVWYPLALTFDNTRRAGVTIASSMLKLDAASLALLKRNAATPSLDSANTFTSSFYPYVGFFAFPGTNFTAYAYRKTTNAIGSTAVASAKNGIGFLDSGGVGLMGNTEVARLFTSTDAAVGDVLNVNLDTLTNMPNLPLTANLDSDAFDAEFTFAFASSTSKDAVGAYLTAFFLTADGSPSAPGGAGSTGPTRLLSFKYTTTTYPTPSPSPSPSPPLPSPPLPLRPRRPPPPPLPLRERPRDSVPLATPSPSPTVPPGATNGTGSIGFIRVNATVSGAAGAGVNGTAGGNGTTGSCPSYGYLTGACTAYTASKETWYIPSVYGPLVRRTLQGDEEEEEEEGAAQARPEQQPRRRGLLAATCATGTPLYAVNDNVAYKYAVRPAQCAYSTAGGAWYRVRPCPAASNASQSFLTPAALAVRRPRAQRECDAAQGGLVVSAFTAAGCPAASLASSYRIAAGCSSVAALPKDIALYALEGVPLDGGVTSQRLRAAAGAQIVVSCSVPPAPFTTTNAESAQIAKSHTAFVGAGVAAGVAAGTAGGLVASFASATGPALTGTLTGVAPGQAVVAAAVPAAPSGAGALIVRSPSNVMGIVNYGQFMARQKFLGVSRRMPPEYGSSKGGIEWMYGFFPLPWGGGLGDEAGCGGSYLQASLFYSAVFLIGVTLVQLLARAFCRSVLKLSHVPTAFWFFKPQFAVVLYFYEGFCLAAALATRDGCTQHWRIAGGALLAVIGGGIPLASGYLLWRRIIQYLYFMEDEDDDEEEQEGANGTGQPPLGRYAAPGAPPTPRRRRPWYRSFVRFIRDLEFQDGTYRLNARAQALERERPVVWSIANFGQTFSPLYAGFSGHGYGTFFGTWILVKKLLASWASLCFWAGLAVGLLIDDLDGVIKAQLAVLLALEALEILLLLLLLPHIERLENYVVACGARVAITALEIAISYDYDQPEGPRLARACSIIDIVLPALLFANLLRAERETFSLLLRRLWGSGVLLLTGHGPRAFVQQALFKEWFEAEGRGEAAVQRPSRLRRAAEQRRLANRDPATRTPAHWLWRRFQAAGGGPRRAPGAAPDPDAFDDQELRIEAGGELVSGDSLEDVQNFGKIFL